MRPRLGPVLAIALTLAGAASAHAQEPAFTGTLSAATPKFTWESSGSGAPDPTSLIGETAFRCSGDPFHCEYILFKVESAGELALTIDNPDGVPIEEDNVCGGPCASLQDLDAYLYKSDATGAPQGDTLTNGDAEAGEPDCATSFPYESCKVKVQPGFYVLEVEYYSALEAAYTGTAELLGAVAPAAPADTPAAPPAQGEPQQPQSQPQPQQAPQQAQPESQADKKKASAKKRRAACTKKAKKIKNKRKRAKALKRCKKIR